MNAKTGKKDGTNTSKFKKATAVIIIVTIGLLYNFSLSQKKRLKKNFATKTGEIESVFISSKNSNVLVRYTFDVNGNKISASSNTGCSDFEYHSFLNKFLLNKSLTVVFETANPKNSEMLFSSRDYKRFKLSVPNNQKPIVSVIDSLLEKK